MSDFTDREESPQDGQPIDLYTADIASVIYRMTNAEEDFVFGGNTYVATSIGRGPVQLPQVGKQRSLTVTMPMNHPIPAALMENGVGPRNPTMLIVRVHRDATTPRQIWSGPISQVQTDEKGNAMLKVPNSLDVAMDVDLPNARIQPTCQVVLYGKACKVDRNYLTYTNQEFMSASSVVSVTGVTIVVDALLNQLSLPRADGTMTFGEIRRIADGERRDIVEHVGTVLVVDVPFAVLEPGDDLEVYRGCDKLLTTCAGVFNNALHFGGHPYLPDENPFIPQRGGLKKT